MQTLKIDSIINRDNDTWKIIGLGTERDGKVFCHLMSTTRFNKQRNGDCPIQVTDWVEGTRIDPRFVDIAKPILDLIEPDTRFTESVIAEIQESGKMPQGRGKEILIKIMTQNYTNGARKNTKVYKQALPEIEELFEKVNLKLSLKSDS